MPSKIAPVATLVRVTIRSEKHTMGLIGDTFVKVYQIALPLIPVQKRSSKTIQIARTVRVASVAICG